VKARTDQIYKQCVLPCPCYITRDDEPDLCVMCLRALEGASLWSSLWGRALGVTVAWVS